MNTSISEQPTRSGSPLKQLLGTLILVAISVAPQYLLLETAKTQPQDQSLIRLGFLSWSLGIAPFLGALVGHYLKWTCLDLFLPNSFISQTSISEGSDTLLTDFWGIGSAQALMVNAIHRKRGGCWRAAFFSKTAEAQDVRDNLLRPLSRS